MTILAGIFSRRKDHLLEDAVCETLKNLISRNPEDKPVVFRDARCFLAKVDIGTYGEPAFRIGPSGSVSMLAGDPLLDVDDTSASRTRTQDLELLSQGWDRADFSLLAKTREVFCAVHYQATSGQVQLITDKLGVRPMYYWAGGEFVIFASVLRILEELSEVPKEMDLRGVTEITTLGYCLSDRTPYYRIRRLKSAEVIEVSESHIGRSQYWRWDRIITSHHSEDKLLKLAYESFTNAVSRRAKKDNTTLAFLSGGLDSRCIVAALRAQNLMVHTFTFASEGSQDRVFAAEFARQCGTFHHEKDSPSSEIVNPLTTALAAAWDSSIYRREKPAERPQLVWSGDGGSVGLGHVYLSKGVTDFLLAGERAKAIEAFLQEQGANPVARLFKSKVAEALVGMPREGIRDELDDIHCKDSVRAFHIFLMLNDQRCHLSSYYENIDLHRFEFQLPFFDGDFLQYILATPVDLCLRHQFYTKWLSLFPPVVKSVPWQTYPGHEPCHLTVPEGLDYQWDSDSSRGRKLQKILRPQLLQDVREMLRADSFPSQILNKWHLRLMSWIYRLGLRDYGYAIKVAKIYHKYSVASEGKDVRLV